MVTKEQVNNAQTEWGNGVVKIGSLKQVGGQVGYKDKNAIGDIDTLVSVTKAGSVIEKQKNKNWCFRWIF